VGERVLLVDDEPRVLDGLRRSLHRSFGSFDLVTATSGADGLALQREALAGGDPFAVIVSDMRMPGMDGAEFLTAARAADPDTVRIVLSGQADLAQTIAAVNHADLFRFLTKPCEPEDLARALDDAVRQHRLVLSERELLERTLRGAVEVLAELLAMAEPEAFARAAKLRLLAEAGAAATGCADDWRLPIATALSQIGCIAIPEHVIRSVEAGGELTAEEAAMFTAHPAVARALLERIPRLGDVATWVGRQPLDPAPPPPGASPAEVVFAGAAAFLRAYETTGTPGRAAHRLQEAGYPQPLVHALIEAAAALVPAGVVREVTARDVREGMVLEEDVVTRAGMVLVRKGERVTRTLALRIHNFAGSVGVVEPITVLEGQSLDR
jgi:CheY-like chemotaxis protein